MVQLDGGNRAAPLDGLSKAREGRDRVIAIEAELTLVGLAAAGDVCMLDKHQADAVCRPLRIVSDGGVPRETVVSLRAPGPSRAVAIGGMTMRFRTVNLPTEIGEKSFYTRIPPQRMFRMP